MDVPLQPSHQLQASLHRPIWVTNFKNFAYDGHLDQLGSSQLDNFCKFLDKAETVTLQDQINLDGSAANPWKFRTMQLVEEVKCLSRVIPKWAAAITYYVAIVQQHTFAVFQAVQSNRRLEKEIFKS
nr:protein nrt1/ ptr family 2.11 [Quercus suber]